MARAGVRGVTLPTMDAAAGGHGGVARPDDGDAQRAGPGPCRASAAELGVAPERAYGGFRRDGRAGARRADGIDAVAIVTPNHLHCAAAKAFLEAGIHVICDKPMTTHARGRARSWPAGREDGPRVRAHAQLHRLPDGRGRRGRWWPRASWADPGRAGRVPAGLARDPARGQRPEAGRVAHRPGALGPGRAASATSARTRSTSPASSPASSCDELAAE